MTQMHSLKVPLRFSRDCTLQTQKLIALFCVVQIRMTADHYAYIAANSTVPFAARNPVPARAVKAGAFIWRASGDAVVPERVTSVNRVSDTGIINPFTMQGGRRAMHARLIGPTDLPQGPS